jgi:hypothetical protein
MPLGIAAIFFANRDRPKNTKLSGKAKSGFWYGVIGVVLGVAYYLAFLR